MQGGWPQLHVMSGLFEAPSQNVLQYLLFAVAMQLQEGCAHFSTLFAIFNQTSTQLASAQRSIVWFSTFVR